MADELADVLVYAVYLAQSLDLNMEDVILAKLKKNEAKYPIEKAFGKKDKYTDL
ncbi:MazG-like family protein [Paenibacillus zanthoxyli]|uniref:MazG-like family protein n=1 Tax=Paenibacillus zanthoxyli TaxID=369399 RepID=UPI0009FF2FD8|nr:MazG-like family protein [Paenibacillus zanthoxyli]